MNAAHLSDIAAALAHARLQARPMALPVSDWLPPDLGAAYALQQATTALLAGADAAVNQPAIAPAIASHTEPAISAWKVSAISPTAQRQMGVPRPIAAPLPARFVAASPATMRLSSWLNPLLECEFAFRLRLDLPPRGRDYTREEVEDAIDTLCLVIEVCDSRLPAGAPLLAQLADGFNNGALVWAPAQGHWRDVAYATHAIQLRFAAAGGPQRELAQGNGQPILDGDPVAALVLMANLQPQLYGGLRAGQIVTTGTCTGAVPFPGSAPGEVEADFGALGSVRLVCTP